ncbi:MAG: OmpH family outer membrane protein [Balneolaceae bacterium]|nr:OmpH family outer membrane protein [Balneolaceae bacterium]
MRNGFCHNIGFLLVGLVLGLSMVDRAEAQEQKIGYVDTDAILQKMPEYQGIDQQLRMLSDEWKKELERMQNDIEKLRQDFSDREILYTEEVRKQKQAEIRELVSQREQYMEQKFGAEGEYYQKQKSLLEPIQRKVFEAINTVADRNDYDFVFDRSGDTGMLFFRQEWNLNDEVLIELGISPEETSN